MVTSPIPRLLVIAGQQPLTTLTLLIAALAQAVTKTAGRRYGGPEAPRRALWGLRLCCWRRLCIERYNH